MYYLTPLSDQCVVMEAVCSYLALTEEVGVLFACCLCGLQPLQGRAGRRRLILHTHTQPAQHMVLDSHFSGGNKCRRSQVMVYFKSGSPKTYTCIPQLLLCMPYKLRYGDIQFGSHFEKCNLFIFPPCRILKPYVYTTQINSQTFLSMQCLRAYRAGPELLDVYHN